MGPRKILFVLSLIFFTKQALALTPSPVPLVPESKPTVIAPEQITPWALVKQKAYPNYKVEIYQRMTIAKFPRIESMKARIIPVEGGSVTQYTGTWLNPDPKTFVMGWKGGLLDLDGDGIADLLLQNYSAGVHCCFNYDIYSLAKPLSKLGNLEMKDCGGQIRLEDLNGDKKLEIISCDPKFIYLGKLPYSESPFPPAVYTLREGKYQRADLDFKQVFLADIQTQRATLAKGYDPSTALQIVTDYFLMGDEAQGWKEFDALYQGDDKDAIKVQLMQRLGKAGTETQAGSPESKVSMSVTPTSGNKLP